MTTSTITQPPSPSKVELSWDDVAAGNFPENPARAAFRQAVADVASQAKEALPANSGRIDSAVKIVLAGDVEMLPDGKAKVASQSNGQTIYRLVNGDCECRDFPKTPAGWCKHKLARALHKRATQLVQQRQAEAASNGQARAEQERLNPPESTPQAATAPWPDNEPGLNAVPAAPQACTLPEAASSVNIEVKVQGRWMRLTLRDHDENRLLARLEALMQRFPVEAEVAQATAPSAGWCAKHSVQMDLQTSKDPNRPGTWYSHRLADGSWCRGR